jgi:hypothetical protein
MSSSSNNAASYGFAWLLLALTAITGGFWWWNVGRPVDLPDAPSARIACVSYAPFRKVGESPLNVKFVIRRSASMKTCVRSRNVSIACAPIRKAMDSSAVPAIAARYHMQVLMGIWIGSVIK